MSVTRREWLLAAASGVAGTACRDALGPRPCHDAPAADPIPKCELSVKRCELAAFDEIQRATPLVYRPDNPEQLRALLACIPKGRTVTARAGGQSLDCQSLNDDLVIKVEPSAFGAIGEPKEDGNGGYVITTGAAARWWDVVEKTARLGLMPPSLPTAGDATVGGSLSADCVSRCSAIYGKEGEQIRSFEIVLSVRSSS